MIESKFQIHSKTNIKKVHIPRIYSQLTIVMRNNGLVLSEWILRKYLGSFKHLSKFILRNYLNQTDLF